MKDGFDKAKDVAQIIALVAVPIVLAIAGWQIQSSMKDSEIRRDYVRMAVGIVENGSSSEDMRIWATQVLRQNSPIPFGQSVDKGFVQGLYITPRIPPPLKEVMTPPSEHSALARAAENMSRWVAELERVSSASREDATDVLSAVTQEAIEAYHKLSEETDLYRIRLSYMQRWARNVVRPDGIPAEVSDKGARPVDTPTSSE